MKLDLLNDEVTFSCIQYQKYRKDAGESADFAEHDSHGLSHPASVDSPARGRWSCMAALSTQNTIKCKGISPHLSHSFEKERLHKYTVQSNTWFSGVNDLPRKAQLVEHQI